MKEIVTTENVNEDKLPMYIHDAIRRKETIIGVSPQDTLYAGNTAVVTVYEVKTKRVEE